MASADAGRRVPDEFPIRANDNRAGPDPVRHRGRAAARCTIVAGQVIIGDIRLTPKQDCEQVATTVGRAGGATRDAGLLLIIALICGALLTSASAEEWTVPDVDALPMDAFGRTVRVGRDLIVNTAATIGPDANDPAKRFSGNGLECQSCHLDAGTKKLGLPLAGVWGLFPSGTPSLTLPWENNGVGAWAMSATTPADSIPVMARQRGSRTGRCQGCNHLEGVRIERLLAAGASILALSLRLKITGRAQRKIAAR
jgi:hypothetical protein